MSMTYEEMLEKVQEAGAYVQGYDYRPGPTPYQKGERVITGDEYIEVYWVSGGLSGGNCWGDVADRARSAETPEDLKDLDKILEVLAPNISYLQFKKIDRQVVTDTRSEYEYYGNYTKYAFKRLKLKDLHAALVEMELI